MDINTEKIVTEIIQNLLLKVWDGVAVSIISKKLSLKAAHLQTFQFIASYISNGIQNRQKRVQMHSEADPKTIQIDNCAYGQLPKQVKDKKANPSRKVSVAQSVNQTRSRRFTIQTFYSKKSNDKLSNSPSQNNNALITLPQKQDIHYVQDEQQDNCRNLKLRNEKQEQQMKKMIQERNKQREQSNNKNKKLLKDMKKYTFDYNGSFVGIGTFQAPNQRMLKLDKSEGEQVVSHRQMKNPQQKTIQNEKIKQRQTRNNKQFAKGDKNMPQFDQNRPQSLLDMFQQDNKLSQGIKLTQQKGKQKVVKQKPARKLSGMKKYRLDQYKGVIKDKKFKDFKRQIYKYSTSTLDVNSTMDVNKTAPLPLDDRNQNRGQSNPIRPSYNSSSQVSLILNKKSQELPKLPPIQSGFIKGDKKLALKKLSRAFPAGYYIESSRTILDQSSVISRKSYKSQIKIDSQQLFFQNFTYGNK